MATRRLADTKLTIPPDATFFDFPWSEGDTSTWPTNTVRILDSDGHVNFQEQIPLDDGRSVRWRLHVADAIAAKLGMPKGPKYILRSWPAGYCLFDHHKGRADDPRHDLYLYGSPKKRFRSVNEFVPHAIWLHSNPPLNPDSYCECKYCAGKKSQKEVTASISQYLRLGQTSSPSAARPKRDKPSGAVSKSRSTLTRLKGKQREQAVYASIQRTMKMLDPSPTLLPVPMLADRSNDIRAMHVVDVGPGSTMPLRRWFREGEVVWCALENPIASTSKDVSIDYWPGIVDEVKLRVHAQPKKGQSRGPPPNSALAEQIPGEPTLQENGFENGVPTDDDYKSGRGPFLAQTEDPSKWKIKQATEYRIHLLAVNRFHNFIDGEVLPYQAHMPSGHLIQDMLNFPAEKYNFDKEAMRKCDPKSNTRTPTIDEAISAFAMAIQIAACTSSMWCLTDEYDVSLVARPASPPTSISAAMSKHPSHPRPSSPPPTGPLSLQDALEAATRHNAAKPTPGPSSISTPATAAPSDSSPQPIYREVESINPDASPSAVEKAKLQVLGTLGVPTPEVIQQTRFQGLWWGAERIWVDDFIRLKIPRRTIAPKGGPLIKPPAGPGPAALAGWEETGREMSGLGAGSRGLFMRLDGLVTVDVPVHGSENGETIKEARAHGMLYELVDSDWKEDDDESVEEPRKDKEKEMQVEPQEPEKDGDRQQRSQRPVEESKQEGESGVAKEARGHALSDAAVDAPMEMDQDQPPVSVSIRPTGPNDTVPADAEPTQLNGDKSSSKGHVGSLLLPQPPFGYRFRAILKPGHDAMVCLGLISGRYYPRILHHPRLKRAVEDAVAAPVELGGVTLSNNLWALEGLAAGYHNSVDPTTYKVSRNKMFEDADKNAAGLLEQHIGQRLAAANGAGGGNEMEVDGTNT